MKRAVVPVLILASSVLPFAADDSPLGLQELIALILERNPEIRQAVDMVSYTSSSLEASRAGRYPEFGLETEYGLAYRSRNQDSFGNEYEENAANSVKVGFYAKHLLPTYGSLELDVADTLTVSTLGSFNGSPMEPRYAQAPAFMISLQQPVFCNGRFIDGRIYGSALQKQEVALEGARESERAVRNTAILETVGLVFDVQNLRNVIAQREKAVEIRNQSLERLNKSLESGAVAETDVARMKVEIGKEKELLLQTVYELKGKEDSLRAALGLEPGRRIVFAEAMKDITRFRQPSRPEAGADTLERNPELRLLQLNVAGKKLSTILNSLNLAGVLTSELSISPRYPYLRSVGWDHDFISSISDFFDPLAGTDISFSVAMKVSLFDAGKAQYLQEAYATNEKMGEDALALKKKVLTMRLESLAAKEKNLEERIRLLSDNLKLLERQKDIDWKLLKIGQITELDLTNVEVEYLARENELEKARMDALLAAMEKLSLLGRDLDKELME